jgi:hypothetical protein
LTIATDLRGRVTSATLRGTGLPSAVRRCIENAVRGATVPGVDTGAASATALLAFHPR